MGQKLSIEFDSKVNNILDIAMFIKFLTENHVFHVEGISSGVLCDNVLSSVTLKPSNFLDE